MAFCRLTNPTGALLQICTLEQPLGRGSAKSGWKERRHFAGNGPSGSEVVLPHSFCKQTRMGIRTICISCRRARGISKKAAIRTVSDVSSASSREKRSGPPLWFPYDATHVFARSDVVEGDPRTVLRQDWS